MENVFAKGLIDYRSELAAFVGSDEEIAKIVASMTVAKKRQLSKTIEEIEAVNASRNILRWFPEKGKHSRDKYPKHMEFFRAGATSRERLFMAANRCLTYDTKIETPEGEISIGELFFQGEEFDVYAWDGEKKVIAKASAPWMKHSPAECVKLFFDNGRTLECSVDHLLLTENGWKSAEDCMGRRERLVGGAYAPAYMFTGVHNVFDITVEKYHNYFAAGVVNHNSGKSLAASMEMAMHLTGMYPDWWEGYRFDKPVRAWANSKTSMMTRDFVQRYLIGPWGKLGTGMIPGDCINEKDITLKRGIPDAVDTITVHGMYGDSELTFKSYDQTWVAFQGVEMDVIWNDEECDELVHNECLTRLMTTSGLYLMTFTPLSGMTKVVKSYLGEGLRVDNNRSKFTHVVTCSWDDVGHLSEEDKQHQRERTPPHLLDAKSKGIPSLGSGAIYPIADAEITVSPFKIPEWWPRCFAMDVGWNRTAAIWGAIDRESDTIYLYSEYYRGMAEPSIHGEAIKARGAWIPGVIDPASRGRSQSDGKQLFQIYSDLGLDIQPAKNGVESGIYEVWQRLSTGRLKVFSNLQNYLTEFRMYQRDLNGKIVKENDHLQDCVRYLLASGVQRATTRRELKHEESGQIHGFVPIDRVCGY